MSIVDAVRDFGTSAEEDKEQFGDLHLDIRRHDRMNLELKLEHAPGDLLIEVSESLVDLWFFLPPAIGVSSETYDSDAFYSDLRAFSRLKTPHVPLSTLAQLSGAGSPLASLSTALARLPAARVERRTEKRLRAEARLLCCMHRRATAIAVEQTLGAPASERVEHASAFAQHAALLLKNWRRICDDAGRSALSDETRSCLQFCDEALSVQTEAAVSHLLVGVEDGIEATRGDLVWLARSERVHRRARGDRSAASPDAEDAEERAKFWDQASLLKKYVSQTLYLVSEEHRGNARLEHIAKGLAAALAMGWTVALQVAMVFLLGLELNSRVDVRVVVLFSLIAVGGYILKDRIKDTVGRALARQIPRLLYDRRLMLHRREADTVIAQVRERMSILGTRSVPDDVLASRADTVRAPLVLMTAASALHYQRRVSVFARDGLDAFARLDGVTDILRLNLSSWVRTLDARRKSVAMVTRTGEAKRVEVPNRYYVDVVAKTEGPDGKISFNAWVLVLTRRGLERVVRMPPESSPDV